MNTIYWLNSMKKKDDNLDNLKFNLQYLLSKNQFKDYENEIEKLFLEKEKKRILEVKT